jgi:hypothetical protein
VAYNFQTGNNNIKLLMEYEGVTQKVLFGNAVLAALMSGRKYDVIPQNGDCSRERNVRTLVFRNIVYKTPVTSLDELKLRIVAAIETDTPQMLENTWREIEYRLDILRATKGAHVEVI